jgi:carbonic anhydrase/acetyltransferase-like protein (isoleucine patch superfamily)
MGAILLDGVVVEKNAMVAAGSLVRQNTKIPSGEVFLWVYNILSDYRLMRIGIMYKLC